MSSPLLNHATATSSSTSTSNHHHHTRAYLDSILTIRSTTNSNHNPSSTTSNPSSASGIGPTPPTLTRSPSFLSTSGSVSAYRPQKPSTLSSAEQLNDDDDDEEEEEEEDESSNNDQDERRALGSLVSKLDQDESDNDDFNNMDSSSSSNSNSTSSNFLNTNQNSSTSQNDSRRSSSRDFNLEPSLMARVGSSSGSKDKSSTTSVKDLQNEILSALDRDEDDEERIEIVREKLNRALIEVEGFEVPSSRLDNIVLDLLHRHREDRNPTGATFPFPASPVRRPSSVRSFTGTPGANQVSRPWTPSSGGGGILDKPGTPTHSSFAESSGSGYGGLPLTPGGSVAATSNSPWNTFGFAASTTTPSGSSNFQLQPPVSPSPQHSQTHPGVIGSGSPRASPRLWNRSITSSLSGGGVGGSAKDIFASASGMTLGSSGVASASSPSSNHSSVIPTSPISSVPPGLTGPSSRPASPSPLGSPRLNVSAAAFKPRTGSSSSSSTASGMLGHQLSSSNSASFMPRGSNLTRRGSATSTSSGTALANKSHAGAGEDDDDEFSPFGSKPTPSFGRPTSGSTIATSSRGHAVGGAESDFGWYSGSASGTSATSSSGGYEPSPLSMAAQASGEVGGEEEFQQQQQQQMMSGSMSPFDVLYSILAGVAAQQVSGSTSSDQENEGGSSSNPAPSWSPEQVEEALSRNGWDVEATLSAIIENNGQPYMYTPPPPRPKSPPSAPRGAIGIASPRGSIDGSYPQHPISHPVQNPAFRQHHHTLQNELQQSHRVGNSGVALLSREAFASHRAATGGSNPASPSQRYAAAAAAASSSPNRSSGYSIPGSGGRNASPARNNFLPPGLGPGGAAPGMPSPYSLAAVQSSQSQGDRRVCRYFLAGECRRADCRFSHNLEKALCRFWLKGQCLNDPCNFVHDNDLMSMSGLTNGMYSTSISGQAEPETPPVDEFPELGMSVPKGPRAQTSKMASRNGNETNIPSGPSSPSISNSASNQQSSPQTPDPSKTRWANAVQRKPAPTPLSLIQGGEASYTSLHSRSAPIAPRSAPPPSGPRSSGLPPSGKVSRLALRAPSLLPTLQTGKQASIAYSNYRSTLLALSEQRNQCLARASQAYRSGNGSQARKWSAEGQSLNAKIVEESKTAALNLLKDRHSELRERLFDGDGLPGQSDEPGARSYKGKMIANGIGICLGVSLPSNVSQSKAPTSLEERTECFIDLHGLHAEEAVEFAEEFLLTLERESMKGLAFLGVGLGRHSATSTDRRRVPLATAMRNFLASWGYPYGEQEGILIVDPLTHH